MSILGGRRRLFRDEVAIPIEDRDFMDLLARHLEIEIDPGESAGDFVKWAIEEALKENRVRFYEQKIERIKRGG